MYKDIKTPSDLKFALSQRNKDSHFFERSTMKFFADTMKNFGLRRTTIICCWDVAGNYHPEGIEVDVIELYRKKPVRLGLYTSSYFRQDNLKFIFPKSEEKS